jgi:hypothetical protein
VQAGMSEEQIQDIAMGVVAAAMESQSMMNQMPEMREESMPMEMMPPDATAGYGTNAAGHGPDATTRNAAMKCTDFLGDAVFSAGCGA